MKKPSNLITATHPELGTLWAAVDPSAHHVEGGVRESRFGARLAPFRSREEAVAALTSAGCAFEPVGAES